MGFVKAKKGRIAAINRIIMSFDDPFDVFDPYIWVNFFLSGFLSLNGFSKNLSIFFFKDRWCLQCFFAIYTEERWNFPAHRSARALSQRPADGNLTGRIFLIIAITHRIVIPGAIFHKDQYVHWRDVQQAIFSKVNFIKVQPCLASVSLALDQRGGWGRYAIKVQSKTNLDIQEG